jgi:D-alanyl-D-alanine carboxypeptidase/D-alanyl-D-alanine-endopeptidase (penicillin-binding protein 4)
MARLLALLTLLVALSPSAAQAAGLEATKRALSREMLKTSSSSGAYVIDLGTGQEIYARKPDADRMPASVEKLYTTAGALLRYGPEGTLTTEVLAGALPDEAGTITGDLVLRGGGDPTLGATAMSQLAAQIAQGGLKRVTGRVIGDESAFDAFRGVPSSNFRLTSDVGPLSALSYNRGRTGVARPYYQASPARFAALAFERALERRGVKIAGAARSGLAPTGMVPFSEWASPPMASIVRQMNQPSDNYIAEMLSKGLGSQFGGEGSTQAGGAVVREALGAYGITPTIADGSGLSRANRTSPREVVTLLKSLDESELQAPFDASLAVIGRSGTVSRRMRGTAAQDRCHAKTGTLSNVSALAGFCDTTGGERIAFAFLMNGVWPASARGRQDRMTVALARYDA